MLFPDDIIYEKTIPVEWMKLVAHEAKQRGVYVHTYEGNHVLSGQDCEEYRSYVKGFGWKADWCRIWKKVLRRSM